jgi:type II secretion system protein J
MHQECKHFGFHDRRSLTNSKGFTERKGFTARLGFTLIEVLIAITIVSFISLFTAQMISQGIKARRKIQEQLDRSSALQSVLNLMSKDIAQAFNYRDVNTEIFNEAQNLRREKAMKAKGGQPAKDGQTGQVDPNQATGQLTPEEEKKYQLKEVKLFSRFIGESDKLNFTTLNNMRLKENQEVSDQAEVGYDLSNCSKPKRKNSKESASSSLCLFRRLSPFIDDKIKEGGNRSVLLENVKSLKFRYLGEGHLEIWNDSWSSVDGEEIMKNKFPLAIEITLTILDTHFTPPKDLALTVVAPLLFPSNKESDKSSVVN